MTNDAVSMLHKAARHYCVERIAFWHKRYAELNASGRGRGAPRDGNWTYSNEAYDMFPRYNVLAAILSDIEHFVPADFATVMALRDMLAAAAESAESMFTRGTMNDIEFAAQSEERRLFTRYVTEIDVAAGSS